MSTYIFYQTHTYSDSGVSSHYHHHRHAHTTQHHVLKSFIISHNNKGIRRMVLQGQGLVPTTTITPPQQQSNTTCSSSESSSSSSSSRIASRMLLVSVDGNGNDINVVDGGQAERTADCSQVVILGGTGGRQQRQVVDGHGHNHQQRGYGAYYERSR